MHERRDIPRLNRGESSAHREMSGRRPTKPTERQIGLIWTCECVDNKLSSIQQIGGSRARPKRVSATGRIRDGVRADWHYAGRVQLT